ncbi:MAG TPA: class I SAM-dependent methyltransferase [Thermoplasmata archaeon]|nr:class I SAM-dependent methyltransferase [Thermoplasmata archaeon]
MTGEVEFDRIAPIYDETRRPPTDEELQVLGELWGACTTILDAGVGTGRFAAPLASRGFDVVGVDLSLEMMRRARSKGVPSLLRADVCRLPLSDGSVDAGFMAHVLQLLPDPRVPLRELARAARNSVVVQLPDRSDPTRVDERRVIGERYRELAAELGHPLPPRGPRRWHTLEELRAIARPRRVRTLLGPPGLRTEGTDRFGGGWITHQYGRIPVPPEVHERIVERIRAEHPGAPEQVAGPRRQHFVEWDPAELRASR